jgi:autotransporter-associated beta strand protein
MTATGNIFWDAGIVNINAPVQMQSTRLRSPTVNIGTGGTLTTTGSFSSIGVDSPDKATINITGTGQMIVNSTGDFNLSDNANTEGTINISDSGLLKIAGLAHVAKSVGGKGTINQTGGTVQLTRVGDFTLVLGSRDGTGVYNMSGGTLTSSGEFYVGQGRNNTTATGNGTFAMSGGVVNQDHWFVVGREGGSGTVDLSGTAIFNKTRGGTNTEIDVFGGLGPASTMTVRGSAEYRALTGDFRIGIGSNGAGPGNGSVTIKENGKVLVSAGELWVGNGGGTGTLNIQGSGVLTTNNWSAIGRDNGFGTLNQTGGSFTKTGTGNNFLIATNAGNAGRTLATGTYNLSGGTFTNTTSESWINEGATQGTWNISGTGSATTGIVDVHHLGPGAALLNLSGTGSLTATSIRVGQAGTGTGTVNLDGGTIAANQVIGGTSSGAKTFNFNGGLLKARQTQAQFMQGLDAANVLNGGAFIDSNGFDVTIAQPLLANGTGGLTKSGTGTLTLAGANTYTGGTTANAGKLAIANSLTKSASVNAANDSTIEVATGGGSMRVIKTPSVTIAANARIDLKDNKLLTESPIGTYSGGAYTGIQGQVARAYDFGSWDLPGLMTSMPDAGPLVGTTTVGVSDGASILFLGPTETGTFAGQTVTGATTIAVYTYAGDVNFDGLVDASDYGIIDNYYQFPGTTGYANGDFNYDGVIDAGDYGIIDNTFQNQGAPIPMAGGVAEASGLSGVTAVPEPASLSVIGIAAASLLGRRRRRA